MASLKPCPYCHCYIATSEARCPFCDRVQRTTGALPAWILGLSLTGLTACVTGGSDGPGDSVGNDGPDDGQVTIGNDSLDGDDDWGEGATYAGPDPSWTGSYPGGTTHTDDDTDDWGEGATYAGPDSWTTSDGDFTTTGGTEADTDTDTDGETEASTSGAEDNHDGSATGGR